MKKSDNLGSVDMTAFLGGGRSTVRVHIAPSIESLAGKPVTGTFAVRAIAGDKTDILLSGKITVNTKTF